MDNFTLIIDFGWPQLTQLEFLLRLSGRTLVHLNSLDEALNRILQFQTTAKEISCVVIAGKDRNDQKVSAFHQELMLQKIQIPVIVIANAECWKADDFEKILSQIPLPVRTGHANGRFSANHEEF